VLVFIAVRPAVRDAQASVCARDIRAAGGADAITGARAAARECRFLRLPSARALADNEAGIATAGGHIMQRIMGKMVCESVEEIVDPKHTALIVVDIQNDHGPAGVLARHGRDVSWAARIVPPVRNVLAEARRRGLLIVFTSNTTSRDGSAESPPLLRMSSKFRHRLDSEGYELEGTWGNEPLEALERRAGERWIVKYRSSAFHGTCLEHILKSSAIASTVIVGLVTEGCVDSTTRDALSHGYYPVLLSDCITSARADLHEAAMAIQRARYDVITSEELLRMWSRARS
jgi:nicotinamidase-related amidase